MYHHVRGRLARLSPSEAVIEAGGIGFRIEIAFPTYQALEGSIGTEVLLYVVPYFREDAQRLFGFLLEEDREYFRLITSVRGFGPSHALSLLSGLTRSEIHEAITAEKPEVLRRVRGIGRKNAERLIVELRERIPASGVEKREEGRGQDEIETARLALQGLGYSRGEAVEAIERARKGLADGNAAGWIRHALQSRK